jgi:hypothetical protein
VSGTQLPGAGHNQAKTREPLKRGAYNVLWSIVVGGFVSQLLPEDRSLSYPHAALAPNYSGGAGSRGLDALDYSSKAQGAEPPDALCLAFGARAWLRGGVVGGLQLGT